MFSFQILKKEARSRARVAVIKTDHGLIQTPAFVPVGTQATVKALANEDLQELGSQIFMVNTYHLYLRPGLAVIKSLGGLHQFIGWERPLMTDSAGFQIFSLGDVNRRKRLCLQVFDPEGSDRRGETLQVPLVKIGEEGVIFRSHLDGAEHLFTPEKSIKAQTILGADIMVAFDECCYYPATHEYAEQAMGRTHRWAVRCLEAIRGRKKENGREKPQALYGVVQGGVYEDLRKESARFISGLPFEGIAIGGVAVGESKKEMQEVLDWVVPELIEEKPRHLLGVGEIDDIFALVEAGIDSFDCVMPTRLARMGFVLVDSKYHPPAGGSNSKNYKEKFLLDLNKSDLADDKGPIDKECECFVCKKYHRAYLNHLFRAKELLAYRLATYHNLFFLENLMSQIRQAIVSGTLGKLKGEWCLKS